MIEKGTETEVRILIFKYSNSCLLSENEFSYKWEIGIGHEWRDSSLQS